MLYITYVLEACGPTVASLIILCGPPDLRVWSFICPTLGTFTVGVFATHTGCNWKCQYVEYVVPLGLEPRTFCELGGYVRQA